MLGGWVIQDRTVDEDAGALAAWLALARAGRRARGGRRAPTGRASGASSAAATGLRIDRRYAIPALFALGGAAAGTEALSDPHGGAIISLFIVTLGVGMLTGGFRRLRVVNRQLGAARDEIGRLAVADERLRFARDLHDLLGHSLSGRRAQERAGHRG